MQNGVFLLLSRLYFIASTSCPSQGYCNCLSDMACPLQDYCSFLFDMVCPLQEYCSFLVDMVYLSQVHCIVLADRVDKAVGHRIIQSRCRIDPTSLHRTLAGWYDAQVEFRASLVVRLGVECPRSSFRDG